MFQTSSCEHFPEHTVKTTACELTIEMAADNGGSRSGLLPSPAGNRLLVGPAVLKPLLSASLYVNNCRCGQASVKTHGGLTPASRCCTKAGPVRSIVAAR